MVGERISGWWSEEETNQAMAAEYVQRFHGHQPAATQCSSALIHRVEAPIQLVSDLPPPPSPPPSPSLDSFLLIQ